MLNYTTGVKECLSENHFPRPNQFQDLESGLKKYLDKKALGGFPRADFD